MRMMCVLVGRKLFELNTRLKKLECLICANHSQSVDDLAATVGVSHVTCYKILTDDMKISRVTQNSVPCILTQDQRDDRMTFSSDLVSSADDQTFLNRIIAGDEAWCLLYDPQLKRHPLSGEHQYRHNRDKTGKKARQWLNCFCYSNGIVHMEFTPEGAIANKTRYKEIIILWHSTSTSKVLSVFCGMKKLQQ